MASSLFYTVYKPRDVQETFCPDLPHGLVEIELTITFLRKYFRHDCRRRSFIDDELHPSHSLLSRQTCCFHLNVMKNQTAFYERLVHDLTRHGINTEYYDIDIHNAVNRIRVLGFENGSLKSNWETRVPITAEFLENIVVHLNNYQEDWFNRALSESELEFEANNYGMVPAEQSSVEKMLKKVNIELGDEDCMICLEELEFGIDASRMPCSHTFHGNCIQNWLKQSHYCPICRFEMPT